MTAVLAHSRPERPARGSRAAWLGLAVLTLPVLLVSMDVSVLFLAMPKLTAQLHPTAAQQLWILDIYGFLIAGLLITMGNVGDRIGRRRILLLGATVFGAASALAAFAPNPQVLIAARALMGIGGATLLPSSLSLISTMFPDARNRSRAIGIWTAVFAGGSAIGPVVGGLLLHHFWWGSVFLINVPVLLVLLAFGPRLLPEHRGGPRGRLDMPSVALSIAGILPTVYAIKHLAADGPDLTAAAAGVVGVVLLLVFGLRQTRLADPLLRLRLFRDRKFATAIAASLVAMMSLAAMSYLTNIYLQSVAGFDVLAAALLGLPATVVVFGFSVTAARIVARFGVRTTFVVSMLLVAAGDLTLLAVGTDGGLWAFLLGCAVAGIGYGAMFALISDVAVAAVPAAEAGAATGISETSFELGNALGLALLGSLAALVFRSGGNFGETLADTLAQAGGDTALAAAARESFVTGLHVAAAVSAAALALTAAVTARTLRR
ncbi:MAG: MFS transporter [Streptomycetaceae bacterium]|nr:MFS transporter [Streptomycetaceae bacterium]